MDTKVKNILRAAARKYASVSDGGITVNNPKIYSAFRDGQDNAYEMLKEQLSHQKGLSNYSLKEWGKDKVKLSALQVENERLKSNQYQNGLLCVEFGYKQCEAGENLDAALINFNKLIK